jgi:hypothetical protein
MKLKEALEWAEKNSTDEAVNRLKSRAAAKVLADHVKEYREWIASHGRTSDTCTYFILNEKCGDCQCKRSKKT